MADFDLFDMVGLAFDPPETNARQIKKKIEQKKAELGSALGRTTQIPDQIAIRAQIEYLEGIITLILSPDGKKLIDSEFKPLAKKKTAEEMESLAATVGLLAMTGSLSVTDAAIKYYKKETRLSEKHVKEVFTNAGFELVASEASVSFPKFPTNVDRICTELAALRKIKDPNPQGADTSVAEDLYSFAAYISNDTQNIALYRSMDTSELWSVFDEASRRFSKRTEDLGTLCASLSTAAKKNVFDSDENRRAYDKYLLYQSPELVKLFAHMKRAPEGTLLNPRFADPCIEIICNYFPEQETALAIYNKEAGFTDKKYEPFTRAYIKKCSICGHLNKFADEREAQKLNSCRNRGCGRPLFKKCGKCGRLIPVEKETCPHPDCGYVFASAALFAKFFQQAASAFRKSDFDAARKYLFQAQTAAPGEKLRIEQFSKQIEKEEAALRKPINDLRQLIAERKYQTARTELGAIIGKYPNLNVTEFEKTISEELSKADALFRSARSMPVSRKADVCISILMQCVDYSPARAFLRAVAPIPCSIISVVPAPDSGVINISWSRSSEQGVRYRLVRKAGGRGSTSENDGDILSDNTTSTSFTDEDVKPGQVYTYSVFTLRMNIFSSPVSKAGILYSDVKNCHASQHGACVRITWDSPDNSRGAAVSRTCDGKTVLLTESAYGSYEDADIQYGKTYAYQVFANYDGNNKSPGIESIITPLAFIDSFSIRAVPVKDNLYKVSWSIRQRGIDLRVMVNRKLSAEVKSDDNAVQISLPRENYCSISVLAYSGGKWLSSDNSVEVNTYTSCGIDKKATRLEETLISGHNGPRYRIDLKIYLSGKIPGSASAFYYAVRTTKSAVRWATPDDIGKASDIQKISCADYQRQGFIPYQDFILNETAFFITVFTSYTANGKEIISEPQRIKIDRPLKANLFWSVTYKMLDGLKLNIEMSGNRPLEYVPELLLCVCDENQFIASYDDKNSQIIRRIPSIDLESPQTEYCKIYTVKTDLPAKYLKKCRFFLFEKETARGDNISLRWKQGFSGKVKV